MKIVGFVDVRGDHELRTGRIFALRIDLDRAEEAQRPPGGQEIVTRPAAIGRPVSATASHEHPQRGQGRGRNHSEHTSRRTHSNLHGRFLN